MFLRIFQGMLRCCLGTVIRNQGSQFSYRQTLLSVNGPECNVAVKMTRLMSSFGYILVSQLHNVFVHQAVYTCQNGTLILFSKLYAALLFFSQFRFDRDGSDGAVAFAWPR